VLRDEEDGASGVAAGVPGDVWAAEEASPPPPPQAASEARITEQQAKRIHEPEKVLISVRPHQLTNPVSSSRVVQPWRTCTDLESVRHVRSGSRFGFA
jgi:hypothetical protein